MNERIIYKVLTCQQWAEFQNQDIFEGAPIDQQDGYIHFSTRKQVQETVRKHFADQEDLVLLAVDSSHLEHLKWEPSRGGDLFPHLYQDLCREAVVAQHTVRKTQSGHQFPAQY